jgi:hypothetical protein
MRRVGMVRNWRNLEMEDRKGREGFEWSSEGYMRALIEVCRIQSLSAFGEQVA